MSTYATPRPPFDSDRFLAEQEHYQTQKLMYWSGVYLVIFLILHFTLKPEVTNQKLAALCLVLLDLGILVPTLGLAAPWALLVFPLGLIWFAEILSELQGNMGGGRIIDAPTPSWMVTGLGWLILLFLSGWVILAFFFAKTGR